MKPTAFDIIKVIAGETWIHLSKIAESTDFAGVLSLNLFEEAIVLLEIEKEFNVILPDDMMTGLRSPAQLQAYII